MAEIKPDQQSVAKADIISATVVPNPSVLKTANLADAPYDFSDRLASTQAWLRKNPEVYRPYKKIKSSDGSDMWIDREKNPIKRSVERERLEIQKYLDYLRDSDPKHYKNLQELRRSIVPMGEKVRVAVNIPAWMEGKIIYHTLDLYSHQVDNEGRELNQDIYEINIVVNRKKGDVSDNSVSEIERFKEDLIKQGKDFQVNYIDVEFPEPFNTVGNARRVITDLTLLRSVARVSQEGQLYIESEDADLVRVDPKTIINAIEKLDQNPHLDAVRGHQDRTPEIMMENDLLFLYRRFQDIYEILVRKQAFRPEVNSKASFNWNRVVTGGWNTAYTAEAYALTRGFDPDKTKDEDMILGERISMLRGNGLTPNTHVIGTVPSRADSSPRRYIHEIASMKPAYGGSFEDPSVNKKIRDISEEKLMDEILPFARINKDNVWRFQSMINWEYWWIKENTPNLEEAQKLARMELLILGFKRQDYKFDESGGIAVESWENVKQALGNYRSKHRKLK